MDKEKVIAWLADEELYYREHGDSHNSLMACDALALIESQDKKYHALEEEWRKLKEGQNRFTGDDVIAKEKIRESSDAHGS